VIDSTISPPDSPGSLVDFVIPDSQGDSCISVPATPTQETVLLDSPPPVQRLHPRVTRRASNDGFDSLQRVLFELPNTGVERQKSVATGTGPENGRTGAIENMQSLLTRIISDAEKLQGMLRRVETTHAAVVRPTAVSQMKGSLNVEEMLRSSGSSVGDLLDESPIYNRSRKRRRKEPSSGEVNVFADSEDFESGGDEDGL
jgi:hypothetical protein